MHIAHKHGRVVAGCDGGAQEDVVIVGGEIELYDPMPKFGLDVLERGPRGCTQGTLIVKYMCP